MLHVSLDVTIGQEAYLIKRAPGLDESRRGCIVFDIFLLSAILQQRPRSNITILLTGFLCLFSPLKLWMTLTSHHCSTAALQTTLG